MASHDDHRLDGVDFLAELDDELSDSELDAQLGSSESLASAALFSAAFAQQEPPPADLERRAQLGASARMLERSLLGLIVELFFVGFSTIETLAAGDSEGGEQ